MTPAEIAADLREAARIVAEGDKMGERDRWTLRFGACAAASDAARSFTSRTDESAAQADILRQYFSAREVGDLFRRATA